MVYIYSMLSRNNNIIWNILCPDLVLMKEYINKKYNYKLDPWTAPFLEFLDGRDTSIHLPPNTDWMPMTNHRKLYNDVPNSANHIQDLCFDIEIIQSISCQFNKLSPVYFRRFSSEGNNHELHRDTVMVALESQGLTTNDVHYLARERHWFTIILETTESSRHMHRGTKFKKNVQLANMCR